MDRSTQMTRRSVMMLGAGALLTSAATFRPASALAAPKSELWPRWEAHDPAAITRVDHAAWDALIARYRVPGPDGVARFDYGAVTAAERATLDAYVGLLAATPVSALARPEQLAFWLNAYNALTVKVILDHYPVRSIRDIDISPGLFADGPWGRKLLEIEGERVSLDDIEHRILRPIWRDPRIHYGVNCASIGCPDLPPMAFTAENADAQLQAGAAAFVNHPRGARFDGARLIVSSIYDWFVEDFGGNDAGVIAHLATHAQPELAARLAGLQRIDDDSYDWSLNDVPKG